MSLPASWWDGTGSPNWQDIRWRHDFSTTDYDITSTGPGPVKYRIHLGYNSTTCGNLCQPDFHEDGESNNNNYNLGMFFGKSNVDSDIMMFNRCVIDPRLTTEPALANGMIPSTNEYEIYPVSTSIFSNPGSASNAFLFWWRPISDGDCELYSLRHYQPFCYYGKVSEVLGAVLKHLVFSTDSIDTFVWNYAQIGEISMGAANWPLIYYRREIGEKIIDGIKRIMQHTKDLLCISMSNKLGLVSRIVNYAPVGPSNMEPTDYFGVIGEVEWRYALEYMSNYCEARHAELDVTWGIVDPFSYGGSRWDPDGKMDCYGHLVDTYQNFVSWIAFGKRALPAAAADKAQDGETKSGVVYHLPFCYSSVRKDALMGRVNGIESYPRRTITVTQDFQGLDYDLGYRLANVRLTGDGQTIADMSCIEKEIDFDNFTVKSVLFEER